MREEYTEEENVPRKIRPQSLTTAEMFFIFLQILRGNNEGEIGVERAALEFDVSRVRYQTTSVTLCSLCIKVSGS